MGEHDIQQQILNELRINKLDLQKSITNTAQKIEEKVDTLKKVVQDTNVKLKDLIHTVSEHADRLQIVETKIGDLHTLKSDFDNFTDDYHDSLETYNKNNLELIKRIEYLETENRKGNLIITGLPESNGEDRAELAKSVNNIFNDVIGIEIYVKPHQVYRRGTYKEDHSRRIVIKLNDPQLKIEILKQGYKLAGSKIFLSPDFTPNQEKTRFFLRQHLKQNGNGKGKFISNFMTQIESQKYYFNETTNKVEPKH